jgi:hypothetical protein
LIVYNGEELFGFGFSDNNFTADQRKLVFWSVAFRRFLRLKRHKLMMVAVIVEA